MSTTSSSAPTTACCRARARPTATSPTNGKRWTSGEPRQLALNPLLGPQLDQAPCQLCRARKHGEVSARDRVDLYAEPLAGDPLLKCPREQPIIARAEDACGHIGPTLVRPWLGEHACTGRTVEALRGARHVRVDVVKEDLLECILAPI